MFALCVQEPGSVRDLFLVQTPVRKGVSSRGFLGQSLFDAVHVCAAAALPRSAKPACGARLTDRLLACTKLQLAQTELSLFVFCGCADQRWDEKRRGDNIQVQGDPTVVRMHNAHTFIVAEKGSPPCSNRLACGLSVFPYVFCRLHDRAALLVLSKRVLSSMPFHFRAVVPQGVPFRRPSARLGGQCIRAGSALVADTSAEPYHACVLFDSD